MKKLTSILLILALVLSLAACSQTKQPDVNGDSSVSTSGDNTSPIPIAFIGSMTGLDEIYGYVSYSAAKMAVEQINEAGGVAGRQIELMYDELLSNVKTPLTREEVGVLIDIFPEGGMYGVEWDLLKLVESYLIEAPSSEEYRKLITACPSEEWRETMQARLDNWENNKQ